MHATATLQQERAEIKKLPIITEAVEEEEVVVDQKSVVESIEDHQVSKDGTTPDEVPTLQPTLDKQVPAPSKLSQPESQKQDPTVIETNTDIVDAVLATN